MFYIKYIYIYDKFLIKEYFLKNIMHWITEHAFK